MPNGHLTPIGGRAAITILNGNARILCIAIFQIGAFFPCLHRMGHGGLCFDMGIGLWGGKGGGWWGVSNHEIRYLLQRASVGAYLKAGLI